MATTLLLDIPPDRLDALRALQQEHARAMVETDKAHLNKDREAEAMGEGRAAGLLAAVRIVADLDSDALAQAVLDTLEAEA